MAALGLVMGLLFAGAALPALAQPASVGGTQVGSPSDTMALNAALARLGRNPRDFGALLDAGNAALSIGDNDAAVGFFIRADQVSPGNAQAKSGLATALVRSGNPFDAIPLFLEAERNGVVDSKAALEWGLAYDLVANNITAQRYYRQALAAGPNDEAVRRLSLSLAIAGDRRGSEAAIKPLLERQDKAAWRTRAFSLAIMGRPEEAVAIVSGTLPPELANAIAPYLRYMPRLTPAQQAAAANFGRFPRASEIGQDDPRVASYATNTRRSSVAAADAQLIPKGEPLGRDSSGKATRESRRERQARLAREEREQRELRAQREREAKERREREAREQRAEELRRRQLAEAEATARRNRNRRTAQASARPLLTAAGPATPLPATSAPTPAPTPTPPRTDTLAAATPVVPPPSAPAPHRSTVAGPTASGAAAVPRATQPPAPTPRPVRQRRVADAFQDLSAPVADSTPAAGAVDIRRIRPARIVENPPAAAKAAAAKPAPPSHPSRIWVQVATGRDKKALAYDWRRMSRSAAALFRGKRAYTSGWNQTNRLLTGPFESESAATAFINQLQRADISAFSWTSPAGQVVDALGAR
ncbi:MAG: SPOR domain-containing protein [Novosphingobium sp.]